MRFTTQSFLTLLAVVAAMFALAGSAMAHHPLGGGTPTTFWHGFLSGVGHPIIGFDHFAFVIAVGLVSAFLPGRFVLPLVFVAATVVGCMMVVNGFTFPAAEIVIAASVLVAGGLVMSGAAIPAWLCTALFAIAGLFHGGAYAAAIVGAESTPLIAYLASFSLTQFLIAVGAMFVARSVWNATSQLALQPRLAGAVVAGIGLTFLIEHIEQIAFGTI